MKLYRDQLPLRTLSVFTALSTLIASAAVLCVPPALADDNTATAASAGVRAGDDFWRFANGEWERSARIPEGQVSWGARAQLRDTNSKKMAVLYEAAAGGQAPKGSAARKTGDYYMAQLDLAAIEARGTAPLRPLLARIAALDSKTALARHLGAALRIDTDPINFGAYDSQFPLGLWVGPGLQDPGHYHAYLMQGGLILPTPDSYLSDDAGQQAVRADYKQYIIAMLEQAGIGDAAQRAERIMALETAIAKVHAAPSESADLAKAGSNWRRAEFRRQAPGLDWDAWFQAAGLSSQQSFGVWQPGAVRGIAALVGSAPLESWRDYLTLHAINDHARFLPKAYADRYYAFFDPLFLGPGQHRPLWEHVLNQTNTDMPAVGQLFAEHYFTPQSKARAQQLVANVVSAFGQRLERLEWMTPASKQAALSKLKNLRIGIAYPDRWQDIRRLDIRPGDAYGNMERAHAFNYRYEIAKLGRPVDRSEWIRGGELFGINPMPLQNALTIPVTELQPPFFDPDGPDAANYGALGARIGRFLALAFDKDGCRFDAQGSLHHWCSDADLANFQKAVAVLLPQFADAAKANSNIADLAGVLAAYDAFHLSGMADKESDRRFFIAYAESQRLINAKAPPPDYRTVIVRNLDAWYSAFDVTPEQALYLPPAARAKIW